MVFKYFPFFLFKIPYLEKDNNFLHMFHLIKLDYWSYIIRYANFSPKW